MKKERLDVVYVLVFDQHTEKILVVENLNSWSLPGGKREEGESLIDATIREAKEETGLEVEVAELINVNEQIAEKHILFFTFRGYIIGGKQENNDLKIKQIKWLTIAETEQLMPWYPNIKSLLEKSAGYLLERE
ncbi:NUDIX hydrolase [Shimazuella sp. AN120528]|uniref:NUDIX hydrolase n=1 Tax=Shimazuella soli TaxID=1892854 RepID=UPI001F0DEF8D|nr:NUDIX hydrolase [Shimazuella soli]MCH5586340.1 NUDIX hydrolase [Shimazuella soli]